MNGTSWQDWYAEVDGAFGELRARCSSVVVAGLSMGGALALRLAEEHGGEIAGLVLVNPACDLRDRRLLLPVLRRSCRRCRRSPATSRSRAMIELAYDRTPLTPPRASPLWRAVTRRPGPVTQPLLLLRSPTTTSSSRDEQRGRCCRRLLHRRHRVVLEDSYHVATLDNDAERIHKESLAFLGRVTGGGS